MIAFISQLYKGIVAVYQCNEEISNQPGLLRKPEKPPRGFLALYADMKTVLAAG